MDNSGGGSGGDAPAAAPETSAPAPDSAPEAQETAAPAEAEPAEKTLSDTLVEGAEGKHEGASFTPVQGLDNSQFGTRIDELEHISDGLTEDINFYEEHNPEGLQGEALAARKDEVIAARKTELTQAADARTKELQSHIDREKVFSGKIGIFEEGGRRGSLSEQDQAEWDEIRSVQRFPEGETKTARLDALKDRYYDNAKNGVSAREQQALAEDIAKEEALITRRMDSTNYNEAKLYRDNCAMEAAGIAFAMDQPEHYTYLEGQSAQWESKKAGYDTTIAADDKRREGTVIGPGRIIDINERDYLGGRYNSNPKEQAAKINKIVGRSEAVDPNGVVASSMARYTSEADRRGVVLPDSAEVAGYADRVKDERVTVRNRETGRTVYKQDHDDIVNGVEGRMEAEVEQYEYHERLGSVKPAGSDFEIYERSGWTPVQIAEREAPLPAHAQAALDQKRGEEYNAKTQASYQKAAESGTPNRGATKSEAQSAAEGLSRNLQFSDSRRADEISAARESGRVVATTIGEAARLSSSQQDAPQYEAPSYASAFSASPGQKYGGNSQGFQADAPPAYSQLYGQQPAPRSDNHPVPKKTGFWTKVANFIVAVLTLGTSVLIDRYYEKKLEKARANLVDNTLPMPDNSYGLGQGFAHQGQEMRTMQLGGGDALGQETATEQVIDRRAAGQLLPGAWRSGEQASEKDTAQEKAGEKAPEEKGKVEEKTDAKPAESKQEPEKAEAEKGAEKDATQDTATQDTQAGDMELDDGLPEAEVNTGQEKAEGGDDKQQDKDNNRSAAERAAKGVADKLGDTMRKNASKEAAAPPPQPSQENEVAAAELDTGDKGASR